MNNETEAGVLKSGILMFLAQEVKRIWHHVLLEEWKWYDRGFSATSIKGEWTSEEDL